MTFDGLVGCVVLSLCCACVCLVFVFVLCRQWGQGFSQGVRKPDTDEWTFCAHSYCSVLTTYRLAACAPASFALPSAAAKKQQSGVLCCYGCLRRRPRAGSAVLQRRRHHQQCGDEGQVTDRWVERVVVGVLAGCKLGMLAQLND